MSARSRRMRLSCAGCAACSTYGPAEMLQRLRLLGMLRREKDPDPDLLAELFRTSAGRLACSACGRTGLQISPADDVLDEEAWGCGRRCESCGQAIPKERLRSLPHVRLCVACQQSQESGASSAPVEYCPKCGAVLRTRLRPGDGLARYEPYCPECRR